MNGRAKLAVYPQQNAMLSIHWLNSLLIYFFLFHPIIAYFARVRYNVWPAQILSILTFSLFLINNPFRIKISGTLKYLGFFVLYASAHLIFRGKSPAVAGYISFLTMWFLYAILANTRFSHSLYRETIAILIAVVISATMVIIYQFTIDRTFLFNYIDHDFSMIHIIRPGSYFGWSGINWGGYSMPAFTAIIVSDALMRSKRAIALLIYALGVLFSFLSLSRYVMLSMLIVGSLFYLYSAQKRAFISRLTRFSVYTAVIIVFVILLSSFVGVDVSQIINSRVLEGGKDFEDTSASTRVLAFELFNQVFWSQPILGTGGRQTAELTELRGDRTSQIHVGWLSLFFYFGIVGAFFFIMFTLKLLSELKQTALATNYWGSYIAFLTYFLSVLTTGVYFDISVAGYVVAYAIHCYYKSLAMQANQS